MTHRITEYTPGVLFGTCSECGENTPVRFRANRAKPRCWVQKQNVAPRSSAPWRKALKARTRDHLLTKQLGKCAICSRDTDMMTGEIDHDHRCHAGTWDGCLKCLRGLLCRKCNMGLGLFCDDPEILRRAIDYLQSFSSTGLASQRAGH